MPDNKKPFILAADSSDYATGAVLSQKDSNGNLHPVGFYSKTLSPNEQNYEIYDKELLSIMRGLREWKPYLQGSSLQTTIQTDHKNLTYFKNPQKLNPRQKRWIPELEEYNY